MRNAIESAITPLVLTYNEEPNIRRTLESLRWAERVVVLDSGSTDATEAIVRSFANADWRVRPFDCHGRQWEYGIRQTGIASPFVLALDADMAVPAPVVEEMRAFFLQGSYAGGILPFEFHVVGRPLAGSIYPAQLRIFRPDKVEVSQPGHTQEFAIRGDVYHFRSPLIHDDRKSLERWAASQVAYSVLEERRINDGTGTRWRDHLRRMGLMPPIAGALAYLRAGGPLKGAAAARYAYERTAFECLLAIRLMTARLRKDNEHEGH